MASSLQQSGGPSSRWLSDHAHQWVEAGVLSEDQAAEIVRLEQPAERAGTEPELTLVAEVVAYLGSLLALMAGAVVVGRTWEQLGLARVLVGVVVAAVAFVAGREVGRMQGEGAQRLCGFLWLIGAAGVALALGTAGYELGLEPGAVALVIGPVLAAIGWALWRNRGDRPLQLVTMLAGVGAALGGLGDLLELDISPWILGIALGSVSVVVGWLAVQRRLHPETWVQALAGAGFILGAAMLGDLAASLGSGGALVAASIVVAVGLWQHRVPVTVIGVIGFLEALMAVLSTFLRGAGSVVVLVAGVAMVVIVIRRSMHRPPPVGPSSGHVDRAGG